MLVVLVVVLFELEIRLRVIANRADRWRFLTYIYMSAVAALPYSVSFAAEYEFVLNILE